MVHTECGYQVVWLPARNPAVRKEVRGGASAAPQTPHKRPGRRAPPAAKLYRPKALVKVIYKIQFCGAKLPLTSTFGLRTEIPQEVLFSAHQQEQECQLIG